MSRLSSDDCRALLDLARRAILNAVVEKRILDFSAYVISHTEPAGALVTLHQDSRLRGCVGQVESPDRLVETISRDAIKAGLPRDAWRESSTRVLAFAAEVFSDDSVRVGHSVGTE